MKTKLRIALVGDYNPGVPAHVAIPDALKLAGDAAGCAVEGVWVATHELEAGAVERLSAFQGIWCVPGSPYRSMDGALAAIRLAREQRHPFLGTCGGFQHVLIEYARNALGLNGADHTESNPNAGLPLIAPLACALRESRGVIRFEAGSRVHAIYGRDEAAEEYNCSYGFNPCYASLLKAGELRVAGVDANGEVRVVELNGHPFFIATLFQPERSALRGVGHPLVRAFVEAAALTKFHCQPGLNH